MEIGSKIRELRLLNQLTLEELAGRCELSKGFLSQVERDLTSPSIATLQDILEALGTSLSEFFAPEKKRKLVFTQEDFFELEKEDHTIYWIVPDAQRNEMEPILLALPAGGRSQPIPVHDGQEFGYVLEGTPTLVQDGRAYPLEEGNTFYLRGNKEHYLQNDSDGEARIIWVSCPPIF